MKFPSRVLPDSNPDSETDRLKMRFNYGPHKRRHAVLSDGIAITLTEAPRPLAVINPKKPDPGFSRIFHGRFPEIIPEPGDDPQDPDCWGGEVWVSRIGNRWSLCWATWQCLSKADSNRSSNSSRFYSRRITRAEALYFISLLLMPAEFRSDLERTFRATERTRIIKKRQRK